MPRSRPKSLQQRATAVKSARSRAPKQQVELPMTAVSYNGPIRTKADKESFDLKTLVLVQDSGATTGVGLTVLSSTFAFENPSSSQDWASAVALYDEYRTLGMEVNFVPNMEECLDTANLAFLHNPIYSVIDRDSNVALTSYGQAANFPSLETHTLTKKWKVKMEMEGPSGQVGAGSAFAGESVWINTSSPPTFCGGILLFGAGLTAATTYGRFIVRYRVQFRGRGV